MVLAYHFTSPVPGNFFEIIARIATTVGITLQRLQSSLCQKKSINIAALNFLFVSNSESILQGLSKCLKKVLKSLKATRFFQNLITLYLLKWLHQLFIIYIYVNKQDYHLKFLSLISKAFSK